MNLHVTKIIAGHYTGSPKISPCYNIYLHMTMIYCCVTITIIDKQCINLSNYSFQLHLDVVKIQYVGHMAIRNVHTGRRKAY